MNKAASNINILHLSDIHFQDSQAEHIAKVFTAMFSDLEKLNKEYGVTPNMLVISGDIAFSGSISEYNMAIEWLNKILVKTSIPLSNVFIVPGNHDVNRIEIRKYSKLTFNNQNDISNFLFKEELERKAVMKKFDNFFEFVKQFLGESNPYNGNFFFSKTVKYNNHKVGIVGLNSAWYSGEKKLEGGITLDQKFLIVGEAQTQKAFEPVLTSDYIITVMHHPISWLADFDESVVKRNIMKHSHLLLHGHTHQNSILEISDPDTSFLELSAGASHLQNSMQRYCLTSIDLNKFEYITYLRLFSNENGFWARDSLTYEKGDGIIQGKIISQKNTKPKPDKLEYPFDKPNEEIMLFIKNNWRNIVLNPEYGSEKIIDLRKKHFNRGSFNPPVHEIAINLIQFLIENKLIRSQEELQGLIIQTPFLEDVINTYEIEKILSYFNENYFRLKNAEIVFKSRQEVSKLKEREFLLKKQEEMEKELEQKIKQKYDSKLQELEIKEKDMQEEYDIFKSKIDDYECMDDSDIPKFPIVENNRPENWYDTWFEELGLIDNPFPSHIELEGFNKTDFEKIIVKTQIYHDFDNTLLNKPESLNRKNILIYGSMGSGKTTFFRYLIDTINSLKDNTFTLFLPLESETTQEEIRSKFYQSLYNKLEKKYFSLNEKPSGAGENTLTISSISNLFELIKQSSNIENFVIFIDDLHKHKLNKYKESVFEFISGLQIFRSHLYEDGHNVTIFISGDLNWIKDDFGKKAIGGSIDERKKIPDISELEAIKMINNRLHLYARNPEAPPIIDEEYIKTIFKLLKIRTTEEITFRDVIEEVEKHWHEREFESVKLSTILDYNTLTDMLLDLEKDHPSIKNKLDQIWSYVDQNERLFNDFVQILEHLYSEFEVSEVSSEFENNMEYYGYLFRAGLITKQRKNYVFVWVITKELRKFFDKFYGKYHFYPREYLSKLYVITKDDRQYITEENSRLTLMMKTGGQYGDKFIQNIKHSNDIYCKILENTMSINNRYEYLELKEMCQDSIKYLLKATINVCDNKSINDEDFNNIYEEIVDKWYENPDIAEFVGLIDIQKHIVIHNATHSSNLCKEYFRAMKSSVSNLLRFMKYNNVMSLESNYIYNVDKEKLNKIRKNYFDGNYALAIGRLNVLLKDKCIDFIYNTNCLLYGVNKWKRGIPSEHNDKLVLVEDTSHSDIKNILQKLDLKDMFEIIFSRKNESIYNYIFDENVWMDIRNKFTLEKELPLINTESIIERKKEEMKPYLLNGLRFIEGVDKFYFSFFTNRIPFAFNFKQLSVPLNKWDKVITSYDIDENFNRKIIETISTDGSIELPINSLTPDVRFSDMTFIDWVFYLYKLREQNKITISFDYNGKIIVI